MENILNSLMDLFDNILYTFAHMNILKDGLDILMISVLVYELIILMRETRAAQLFKGILLLGLVYLMTVLMNLTGMKFILDNFFFYIIVIVVVIFQPELRRMLEHIGQSKIPGFSRMSMSSAEQKAREIEKMVDTISSAAEVLSSTKTGALIVIERNTKLGDIIQSGTVLDAAMSVSLLGNIFYTGSPLHDGAVVVRDCKVYAAGCFLPLMQRMDNHARYGTRHRAAIGMSENSDALVVVVSEETGTISLAHDGRLQRDFDKESLSKVLNAYLAPHPDEADPEEAEGAGDEA